MHQQREPEASGASTDALYERYGATIFTYLRQHTNSREDAEDILLDTFTAAMEDAKFPHHPEQSQVAWLWRVARNKVIDAYRKTKTRRSVPLEHITETVYEHDAHNPETVALRLDNVAEVQQLLQQLPAQQQEILWLRFGYNLRCTEIASIVGKRESAVRTMLSRTMNALRHSYKKTLGRED